MFYIMSLLLAELYYIHFRTLKLWLKNDVSVTSYKKGYPIQIYISNHVLHYVFTSDITLLNSFLEFETWIKKWCQCDLLLTVIFYSKSHFKSCFTLCLCFLLNFTTFVLGNLLILKLWLKMMSVWHLTHSHILFKFAY